MIPNLKAALAGRFKFVEEASQIESATGTGRGLSDGIRSAGSKFAGFSFVEKSPTGYVGLVNQGATCYLNSLLQTLYMTPEFRKAVYEWRYAEEIGDEERCLPLQLQRLFSSLQLSVRGAVSTGDLTRSFGWRDAEAFVQHDVQECMSVIFDHLATGYTETTLGRHVLTDQQGMLCNYIRCGECGQSREREEVFRALPVQVRGMNSLQQSLTAFSGSEVLEGDNAVDCAVCGKRTTSHKGVTLSTLPSILTMQMQRFDFNWHTMTRMKINDPFTFPDVLDMKEWCPNSSGTVYDLYSVMMHTGSAVAGHYFAYIKDLSTGVWLHFNDSQILEIPPSQVSRIVQAPEGTVADIPTAAGTASPKTEAPAVGVVKADGDSSGKAEGTAVGSGAVNTPVAVSHSNAYMLVYRRRDSVYSPTSQVEAGSVPPSALVSPSLLPETRLAEIAADNEKYVEMKAAYDLERQMRYMQVMYKGQVTTVAINENTAAKELLTQAKSQLVTALSAVNPAEVVDGQTVEFLTAQLLETPLDRCRLRLFNTIKSLFLDPVAYSHTETTLKALQLTSNQTLVLERMGDGTTVWSEWYSDSFPILLALLNVETHEYAPSIQVNLKGDLTVGTLRRAAEEAFGLIGRCRLVTLSHDTPIVLNDDTTALCAGGEASATLRMIAGDTIQVEPSDTPTLGGPEASLVVRLWESVINEVSMSFNSLTPDEPDFTIPFDRRGLLSELKAVMATTIGVPASEFKILRTATGPEIKDLDKQLTYFGMVEGGKLFLVGGTPLLLGQNSIRVSYVLDTQPKPVEAVAEGDAVVEEKGIPLQFLTDLVVTPETTTAELKVMIASQFPSVTLSLPNGDSVVVTLSPDKLRVREIVQHKVSVTTSVPKLGKVLIETHSLATTVKPAKMTDGKAIGVHITAVPEAFQEGDLLINLRSWDPVTLLLGSPLETVVSRRTPIAELLVLVSTVSGLPTDALAIAKPSTWQLKNAHEIANLKWRPSDSLSHTSLISAQPLALADGATVLYKEARVAETLAVDAPSATSSSSQRQAPAEAAFVIYSAEQQRARDAERRAKEEAEKAERDAHAAVISTLLSSTGADAPDTSKYVKLVQLGQPIEHVKARMKADGVDPDLLPL